METGKQLSVDREWVLNIPLLPATRMDQGTQKKVGTASKGWTEKKSSWSLGRGHRR